MYTKKRKKLNDHRGATAALHAAWFQLPSSKHAWHRNTLQCAQPHLDLYTFLLLDASLYPALHADFGFLIAPPAEGLLPRFAKYSAGGFFFSHFTTI